MARKKPAAPAPEETSEQSRAVDDLSVQQIRAFCAVVDRQSYSAAARDLRLSVPTIWAQVRALERRYDTELFERKGRRIAPRPAAHLLYNALNPLLAGLESTIALLREHDGTLPAVVRVVVGARMMLEDLGEPLRTFHAEYPDVLVRIAHGDDKKSQAMVADDQADFALSLEPGPGMLPGELSAERAYDVDYLAVAPNDHPLARLKQISLKELVKHPLVLGHRATYGRRLLEQALHREGLLDHLRVIAETDNSAFTLACVHAGLGAGVLAGRPGSPLVGSLSSHSLGDQVGQARIVFISKKGRQHTSAVSRLIELIRTCHG